MKKVTKLIFIVLFLIMYTPSYVNAEEFIADDGIIESQVTDISAMPGDILPMSSTEASTQSKVNFNNTDNYGDFFLMSKVLSVLTKGRKSLHLLRLLLKRMSL